MIINHNLNAMNAHRQMGVNTTNAGKAMEKLSSGLRINRAGDDAAGLAISEKMRGQIRGLNQASRNAQDGISLIQTGEGALTETHSILQRMRELAVQSSNDTNVTVDRGEIQKEIDQLSKEITRIADTTEFNTQNLLKGDFKGTFHIGANKDQNLELSINKMGAADLGVAEALTGNSGGTELQNASGTAVYRFFAKGAELKAETATGAGDAITADKAGYYKLNASGNAEITNDKGSLRIAADAALDDFKGKDVNLGINVSDRESANDAIKTINDAIENVSAERSKLGAYQNRLEHTIANLDTSSENLQASESRVRDVDMAKEMMNFSKNNILQQAAQAMLAQANQAPQGVLQLLR